MAPENMPVSEPEFGAHEPTEPTLEGSGGDGGAADDEITDDLATHLGGEAEGGRTGEGAHDEGNRGQSDLLEMFGLGDDSTDRGGDEFAALLEGTEGKSKERIQGLIAQVKAGRKESAGYLQLIERMGVRGEERMGVRGEGAPSGEEAKDDAFKPVPIEKILEGMDLGEGEEADAMRADITKLSPILQKIAAAQNAELTERFNGMQLFAQEADNQATQTRLKDVLGDRWNPKMQSRVKQMWASMGSPPGMDTAQGIIVMAHAIEGMTGEAEQRGKGQGRREDLRKARRTTLGAGTGSRPGGDKFAKGSILSMGDKAFKKLDGTFDDDGGI